MSEQKEIRMNGEPGITTEQHDSTQHYEVLMELADCLTSVGKYDEAQQRYEEAASLAPDAPGPYVGLGVIALQKDAIDDAEIAFRVGCRLDPDCARAYAGLAMVSQERRDYTQAFTMYLKCLEVENDNLTALLGLFQTSCQMGSFEKIVHYLRVYLDVHPGDVSVMFALAALHTKDGRAAEARKVLQDILALNPSHKEAADLLEEVERGLSQAQSSGVAAG